MKNYRSAYARKRTYCSIPAPVVTEEQKQIASQQVVPKGNSLVLVNDSSVFASVWLLSDAAKEIAAKYPIGQRGESSFSVDKSKPDQIEQLKAIIEETNDLATIPAEVEAKVLRGSRNVWVSKDERDRYLIRFRFNKQVLNLVRNLPMVGKFIPETKQWPVTACAETAQAILALIDQSKLIYEPSTGEAA